MKIYANYTGLEAFAQYQKFEDGKMTAADISQIILNCKAIKTKTQLSLNVLEKHSFRFRVQESDYMMYLYNILFGRGIPNKYYVVLENMFKSELEQKHKDAIEEKILSAKAFSSDHASKLTAFISIEKIKPIIDKYIADHLRNNNLGYVLDWINVYKGTEHFNNKDMKRAYFNQYKYLFQDELITMKNKNQFDRFARIFRNVLSEDFQYAFEMGCIKADVGSYSGLFTKAKKDDISPGMTIKYIVDYITDKNIQLPQEIIDQIDAYELIKALSKKD